MTAPLAYERRLLRQTVKARAAMTLRAARRISESDFEQMLQTHVVCRKSARELAENLGL
jgi:hypothetical protein